VKFIKSKSDLKAIYNEALENPIFDNGHKLQSDIGKAASRIKSDYSSSETDKLNDLIGLRKNINSFLSDTLKEKHPDVLPAYEYAGSHFQSDVLPYYEDKAIHDIAHRSFTDINGNVNAKAVMSKSNALLKSEKLPTVSSHLDSNAASDLKNRLVYNELNGMQNVENPQKVVSTLKSVMDENKELVHPEIRKAINPLQDKIKLKM